MYFGTSKASKLSTSYNLQQVIVVVLTLVAGSFLTKKALNAATAAEEEAGGSEGSRSEGGGGALAAAAAAWSQDKAAADAKVGILANMSQFVCVLSKSTLCFLCLRGMETIDFETILNFLPVSPPEGQTP